MLRMNPLSSLDAAMWTLHKQYLHSTEESDTTSSKALFTNGINNGVIAIDIQRDMQVHLLDRLSRMYNQFWEDMRFLSSHSNISIDFHDQQMVRYRFMTIYL